MKPPSVSYLIPVLNEAARLPACVAAVLDQDYVGEQQVVIAVAPSTDGTESVAQSLATTDPRIHVVDNPRGNIPAGLNAAIAASSGEVLVRVDAHSELPAGYTRRMVSFLLETGAANVGGLMRAKGATAFQESVARAYNSGLGLGGGVHHSGEAGGTAETAYLGVFRRGPVLAVGGFDESLLRTEDYELNQRLLRNGHDVRFVPGIEVTYWPRDSWTPLARQMWATGVWRGALVRRERRSRLRYLAAPALVVGLLASAVRAVAPGHDRQGAGGAVHLVPLSYAGFLLWAAGRTGATDARDQMRDVAVLATIHTTWGAGFLKGLIGGAGSTVDRSRVRPLR